MNQLIPFHKRIKFVAAYVFVTVMLWVLFGAFFSLSSVISNVALQTTLNAIVTGLMVGMGQWLVLRSYLPTWMWIVATAAGSGLVTLTQNLWYSALLQTMQQSDTDHFLNFFLNTPLSIILPVQGMTLLAFCLWFAGAQWLVLRYYVKAAAWWFLTPAIAILSVWVLLILQLILLLSGVLQQVVLQQQVLLPGLLAATQALILCRLQRQEPILSDHTGDDREAVNTEAADAGAISLLGLTIATIAGVLVLSLSVQGFLIWFRFS